LPRAKYSYFDSIIWQQAYHKRHCLYWIWCIFPILKKQRKEKNVKGCTWKNTTYQYFKIKTEDNMWRWGWLVIAPLDQMIQMLSWNQRTHLSLSLFLSWFCFCFLWCLLLIVGRLVTSFFSCIFECSNDEDYPQFLQMHQSQYLCPSQFLFEQLLHWCLPHFLNHQHQYWYCDLSYVILARAQAVAQAQNFTLFLFLLSLHLVLL